MEGIGMNWFWQREEHTQPEATTDAVITPDAPEQELGGRTIFRTPAICVPQKGSPRETTIRIKDGGGGWVVVWDEKCAFFENFMIAGSKSEVSMDEGQLRLDLTSAGVTLVYVITKDHETSEDLKTMFARLQEIEAVVAA